MYGLLEEYFETEAIQNRNSRPEVLADLETARPGYLLALEAQVPLGCVLGRPCATVPGAAEMKRLFVTPAARGQGLATHLIQELERVTAAAGFPWLYLDSRARFTVALSLYRKLGYEAIPRYNGNPEATVFFRKALA